MGFFSYECKHCDHSILSSYSADPEINAWMKDTVVLSPNGSRTIGEYGGYGDISSLSVGDGDIGGDAVWLHQACWEVAGKPEYDHFRKLTASSKMSRRSDRKVFAVVSMTDDDEGAVLSHGDEQVSVNKVAEGLYTTKEREVFETIVGSDSAGDQGFFFGKEHDVIDPRITDEAERERLLTEGVEKRERRWYDQRARDVAEWFDPKEREYHDEDKQAEPWRHRFSYSQAYENQEEVENGWWLRDQFNPEDGGLPVEDADGELLVFKGTEDECKAYLASLWAQFVESDDCKAYLARRKVLRDEGLREEIERLKKKGRYEVSYGAAPKGDTVKKEGGRDWVGKRTIYRVEDRLDYETVATMDGPDKALGVKTFTEDPGYDGNSSPEWEARMEEVRVATQESHRLAEEEARRLNKQWAADGYPMPDGSDD